MLHPKGKSAPGTQAGSLDAGGTPPPPVTPEPAGADRLPFEPAEPEAAAPDDRAALGRELERFYRHGDSGAAVRPLEDWPALLNPYRDLTRIRHPYPLCLGPPDDTEAARPLTAIVDQLIERMGLDGDARERLKRHLYRLEAELRVLAEEQPGERLEVLWERAATRVVDGSSLSSDKRQGLEQDLVSARAELAADGELELLPCDGNVARRLVAATMATWWPRRGAPWRERLDPLIAGLENILRADFGHSPEALSSDHLSDTVGQPAGTEMDFDQMSRLLSRARLHQTLPAARRQRLERTLAMLRNLRPLFEPGALAPDGDAAAPFSLAPVEDDCARAVAAQQRRVAAMVDLARAVRTAELEIDNRYRDEVHDARFGAFAAADLSDDELSGAPPLVLHLTQPSLGGDNPQALLELLASGMPVKVLLELDDLVGDDVARAPPWAARLALMAISFDDVFVLQCPVSRPDLLEPGIRAGLDYPGPALFAVYTGAGAHCRLPPYLDAAAAADSRAFPAFRFDPGAGAMLAQRIALLEPTDSRPWPIEALRYQAADGGERETELAFTAADFLYCDRRRAGAFRPLPPDLASPSPVPVDEFFELDAERAAEAVPVLRVVTADGQLARAAVSGAIVAAVARTADQWRALKETAGIDNSFAQAALAQQRADLERDFAEQVARIETEYEQRLETDVGELTREIVERIAARLISGDAGALPIRPTTAPPAAPAEARSAPAVVEPEPSAPETPEPADDDDEVLSLDEPYIDTPLCTSCDDCTKMSPQIFAYDDNKQAYIKDAQAGTFRELVLAAEKCPVNIIHPGKPLNPDEPQLEEWLERAKPFR